MHELSVCRGLLKQVQRIAEQQGAIGISKIALRIGPLSGVEPALLRQAFPALAKGSCAQSAALVIACPPIRVACDHCGAESEAEANRLNCSACGDWHTRLLGGDEMLLESVELRFHAD